MTPNQSAQTFHGRLSQELLARYLLFLPQGYEAGGSKTWPLLLFLHGSGERGVNPFKVAQHGPPRLVQERPDFPFIVVSPQCPSGQFWSTPLLFALLDEILATHRVDVRRVYVTGLSMGGFAAWNLGLLAPERFAAIVPICGGGDVLPVLLADDKKARALRGLGIWAFHGERDSVVPVQESRRMVEALQAVGNSAKLTVYPDAEHDSWTATYSNPLLFKWLLMHQRRFAKLPRPR